MLSAPSCNGNALPRRPGCHPLERTFRPIIREFGRHRMNDVQQEILGPSSDIADASAARRAGTRRCQADG
jgi:hypothetical protein